MDDETRPAEAAVSEDGAGAELDRNELSDFLDGMEREGHAELADHLRRARREYISVEPLIVDGKDTGLLEVRYRRKFNLIKIAGGGSYSRLGDDTSYIYASAPIEEAELLAFSVDTATFTAAWEKTRAAGGTFEDMDWSGVKIDLSPYDDADGGTVLYIDMLLSVAVAAPAEDGDDERAGRIVDLIAEWDGGKRWIKKRLKNRRGEPGSSRPRGAFIKNKTVLIGTDNVSSAIFNPGSDDYITPDRIWSGEPSFVKTGRGKDAQTAIQLALPRTVGIDDDPGTYMPTPRQQYWLSTVHALVKDGYRDIDSRMLLERRRFKNPYSDGMKETREDAAAALLALTNTKVLVDTTDEYGSRHGRRNGSLSLNAARTLRQIVPGEFTYVKWTRRDGTPVDDFVVHIPEGDMGELFPLYEYQEAHGMLEAVPGLYDCLDDMPGLKLQHRILWDLIMQRVLARKMQNKFVLKRLYDAMGIGGTDKAARGKQERMKKMLEKMLDRAKTKKHMRKGTTVHHTQLFESWRWYTNSRGEECLEVVPVKGKDGAAAQKDDNSVTEK